MFSLLTITERRVFKAYELLRVPREHLPSFSIARFLDLVLIVMVASLFILFLHIATSRNWKERESGLALWVICYGIAMHGYFFALLFPFALIVGLFAPR